MQERQQRERRLEGKRAIITGAASGIGRASALLFAREGGRLVLCDKEPSGLAETVAQVSRESAAASVEGSVSDSSVVKELVDQCVGRYGGVDVFFANAGISGGLVSLLDLEPQEFRDLLDVNLIGPFLAIKHSAPKMIEQGGGGSIVCTASVAALRSGAGAPHYSASKAGVVSLVQTAANQLAGTGVRVNAICPGLIETGMTRPLFDYARAVGKEGKIGQLNPLRRAGAPEEIARVALFLASDESSYVNGQAWAVDGGLSSSLPVVPGRMA